MVCSMEWNAVSTFVFYVRILHIIVKAGKGVFFLISMQFLKKKQAINHLASIIYILLGKIKMKLHLLYKKES